MKLEFDSKLLRIFIGELDKLGHRPLYEAILFEAMKQGMAGCTILRGIMSFGASANIHTAKLIEISQDLPVVIEIVDHEEKISAFAGVAGKMMKEADCGGLITVEKAGVLYYRSRSQEKNADAAPDE